MSDVCIEECAISRDTSWFELKPGLRFVDLPRYPIDEVKDMTKEEKFTSVVVYISKIADHLKGVDDGEYIHSSRSGIIFEDVKKQIVSLGSDRKDSTCEDREKCENQGERSTKLDQR